MKLPNFKTLDDLINFERKLEWRDADKNNVYDLGYRFSDFAKKKIDRLKSDNLQLAVYENTVVSAVSDQFDRISVEDIVSACEGKFGGNFSETGYKQGIVRIYEDVVIEKQDGKILPLVVFPANLGTMAVTIGLYHEARVCSNGLFVTHPLVSEKIIHKVNSYSLSSKVDRVLGNMQTLDKRIEEAKEKEVEPFEQLTLITNTLKTKDSLLKKAFDKYYPKRATLWETVQTITYVSTHETKREKFLISTKAARVLLEPKVPDADVVDAAATLYLKKEKSGWNVRGQKELFAKAAQILSS